MATQGLHELLACLSRVLQGEQRQQAVAAGLPAVQWTILHYLRQANRYSNTPQALGEYLGLTKGTVSQSLKRLEARGWVKRVADARDGRVSAAGRGRSMTAPTRNGPPPQQICRAPNAAQPKRR